MLTSKNCPAFGAAIYKAIPDWEKTITDLTDVLYPSLQAYLGKSIDLATASTFCNYLIWADLNNIKLTFNYKPTDIT